jgi:hypothetical protein
VDGYGIKKIFRNRAEAREEVVAAINGARRRLWLLGVGISKIVRLSDDDLFTNLREKLAANASRAVHERFDARILMLNPLSSVGVFRTFLESTGNEVRKIIETPRSPANPPRDEPYFARKLYSDFRYARDAFRRHDEEFASVVRFYAHTPPCWLVIADDTAYYEPYTFGRPASAADPTLGHLMPVFKVESGADPALFEILQDHFDKLWLTTDVDMFHILTRMPDKNYLLCKIFTRRHEWLEHIYGVLFHCRNEQPYKKPFSDQRRHPRRHCKSGLKVTIRPLDDAGGKPVKAEKVLNFSRAGLALKLDGHRLKRGDMIRLEVIPRENEEQPEGVASDFDRIDQDAGYYVKSVLVDPCHGVFKVRHPKAGVESPIVGLAPYDPEQE